VETIKRVEKGRGMREKGALRGMAGERKEGRNERLT
jgi:hypothetical protein